MSVVCVFAAVAVAGGGSGSSGSPLPNLDKLKAYVPDSLISAIEQNPTNTFDVIVQGEKKGNSNGIYKKLTDDNGPAGASADQVRAQFNSINGLQVNLTGRQIAFLADKSFVTSIMPNESVKSQVAVLPPAALPLSNSQLWPWATGAPIDWTKQSPDAATIAVVDSGIDASRVADFGGRVIGQVNLASLAPNSPGDGYGHGTFVAGIAAGAAPGYAGAAPKAELLSLDVMNDEGQATVADVVKACDYILANKVKYNIRVANFSLHAVNRASVLFDPLDQAVEKLWLNGIVVVTASGNYGTPGTPSGVPFAPGNDPFVITVGASDIGSSVRAGDDQVAPFSAYGYTPDGFFKPEIGAPGRYMVGPVPVNSGLPKLKPANVTDPVKGYMQLSGTSFAAPIVSAAAAMLVAQHPTWTPDQVKAVLMLTATPQANVAGKALGVGDVNLALARMYNPKTAMPNPNAGLNKFVKLASDGTRIFDGPAWQKAALADKAWNAAAWSDVAWSDAAWSSVAWGDAAWADVAWASAAWGSAAWSDVAWSDAAWSDAAWADNANDTGVDEADAASAEQNDVMAQLGITSADCDPVIAVCSAVTTVTSTVGGLLP